MKQTITLVVTTIFCFSISANAQINKGSIMLGGSIGGSLYTVNNPDTVSTKSNGFSFQPVIGFAIDDNTFLGLSLLIGGADNKYYQYDQKRNSYGAGVFLRKYKPLSKNFYLFGEGNLMYSHETYNYSSQYNNGSEYDSKENSIYLNITPGVAYSLTRSIQLEAGLQNLLSIGYSSAEENAKTAGNEDYKMNSFSAGSSLNPVSLSSISIGLRFFINKK